MRIAESRVTSQGQISVPAEVRRRLGIGPGDTLVWDVSPGNQEVALRPKRGTLADVQAILAGGPASRKSLEELDGARREAWLHRWKRQPRKRPRR
jgi:antitoxin PrlF